MKNRPAHPVSGLRATLLSGGLFALVLLAAACGGSPPADTGRPGVVVSILPQAWFVQQMAGDLVDVTVLVGPGHSPATYEPTPRQLARLQSADLFLAAGVPFERGLLPKLASLPVAPPIAGPRPAPVSDGHDHGHVHGSLDPHTWLDPGQARALADTLLARLTVLLPDQASLLNLRHANLDLGLRKLDNEIAARLAPFTGRTFYVFHPAFGHFAAAYGLVQVAVEDDGHEPGPRQLAAVIDRAVADGATAIVVQPQFSRKTAGTVAAAAGLTVVELDPLGADYDVNLRHIAGTLVDLFTGSAK